MPDGVPSTPVVSGLAERHTEPDLSARGQKRQAEGDADGNDAKRSCVPEERPEKREAERSENSDAKRSRTDAFMVLGMLNE